MNIVSNTIKPHRNEMREVTEFWKYRTLLLDFKAETSYDEFIHKEAWKKIIWMETTLKFTWDNSQYLWDLLKEFQNAECLSWVKFNNWKILITMENFMRFCILKQCICRTWNSLMQKEIWDLLRWDVKEHFYSIDKLWLQWVDFLHLLLSTDLWEYRVWSAYVKYLNSDWKWRLERQNKRVMDILWENYNWWCFKTVKYEECIEENNYFSYITYCIINLHKKLFLIYWDNIQPSYVWIVEKSRLNKYLRDWAFVIDISRIVTDIFCNVFKWSHVANMVKLMEKSDEEREKFYNDLRNDAWIKNKISINADIEYWIPTFMSAKYKDTDMNKYKELEKRIWEDWEISKKKWKWKYNTVTAKKQHVYWNKDDIKALKKMKKK